MEGEKTKDQAQTIQNIKLAEYVWPNPDIWIKEEGDKLIVSVKVAVNTIWATLRQEEGKWVGNGATSCCVGFPTREVKERENILFDLMSSITDVRILSTKSKGKGLDCTIYTNNILCRRYSGPSGKVWLRVWSLCQS